MSYKYFRITIKEVDVQNPIVTEYYGNVDEDFIIKFYGLDEPDVEWYEIEQL